MYSPRELEDWSSGDDGIACHAPAATTGIHIAKHLHIIIILALIVISNVVIIQNTS
jgi:hypothetical protein